MAEEVAQETSGEAGGEPPKKLLSKFSTGMEASVLRVKNVNFTVGKDDKKKYLLSDINVKVKWGHVLAREYQYGSSFGEGKCGCLLYYRDWGWLPKGSHSESSLEAVQYMLLSTVMLTHCLSLRIFNTVMGPSGAGTLLTL